MDAAGIWVLFSAVLCAGGWILSSLHVLNAGGYAVLFSAAALLIWKWPGLWHRTTPARLRATLRRFRCTAPRLFLLLAGVVLLATVTSPIHSDDSLQYRVPRTLHWLYAGQWHWIRTLDYRANTRGCGFEWLSAPLVLLTRSDRLIFLANLVPFLLLPGLVFGVFRRLGIGLRGSWWCMWLLPAGLCYCVQACSAASDSYLAVYVLAGVYFALRAGENGRPSDLWLSLLATALVTAGKQTNIPLALPCLLAAAPSARLLLRAPVATALLIPLALGASGLPLIMLNAKHGFTWAGLPVAPLPWDPWGQLTAQKSPLWAFLGNAFCLLAQNLVPPFFFLYEKWNGLMASFLTTNVGAHFRGFESFGRLSPFAGEQDAGLGLPLFLFLLLSAFSAFRHRGESKRHRALSPSQLALLLVPWPLFALFMAKIGAFSTARMLAPYYVLLLPWPLRHLGLERLTRRRWWRSGACMVLGAASAWIIFLPNHPLWGASLILKPALRAYPHSALVQRAASFYGASAEFSDEPLFASSLPAELSVVGYATDFRGVEPALWRPFSRRVERVLPSDSPEELTRLGITYLVLDDWFLALAGWNLGDVKQHFGVELVDTHDLYMGFGRPPFHLYLFRRLP